MNRAQDVPVLTVAADVVEPLTKTIIACAIEVHRSLGPGLLESVYQECMIVELQNAKIEVESDRAVPIEYKGRRIRGKLRLDLLVGGCIIVELKAVETLHPIYLAQVMTYLKLSGCPAGLLMNFNTASLRSGLRRLDHPDFYIKKRGVDH